MAAVNSSANAIRLSIRVMFLVWVLELCHESSLRNVIPRSSPLFSSVSAKLSSMNLSVWTCTSAISAPSRIFIRLVYLSFPSRFIDPSQV